MAPVADAKHHLHDQLHICYLLRTCYCCVQAVRTTCPLRHRQGLDAPGISEKRLFSACKCRSKLFVSHKTTL